MGMVNGMGIVVGRGMLCTLALACAVRMGIETRPLALSRWSHPGSSFPRTRPTCDYSSPETKPIEPWMDTG